jgi:anaphase-promoting complex subunit 1
MLFLGQGKASFKRDDVSIGALVLSTSPRFPYRTMENISHLQALRHMYVIAVEERCLHAIDVDTGVSTPLEVEVCGLVQQYLC